MLDINLCNAFPSAYNHRLEKIRHPVRSDPCGHILADIATALVHTQTRVGRWRCEAPYLYLRIWPTYWDPLTVGAPILAIPMLSGPFPTPTSHLPPPFASQHHTHRQPPFPPLQSCPMVNLHFVILILLPPASISSRESPRVEPLDRMCH